MKRILALMFLSLIFISCNKDGVSSKCTTTTQAETSGPSPTTCTVASPPVSGEPVLPPDLGPSTDGTTTGSTTDGTTGPTTGLPTEAFTFSTNLEFINTTSTQQDKFDEAVEVIKRVVATEEFRSQVLNHSYGGKKTFVDNGGYTNAEIYQIILDGSEKLQPAKDNEMDMEVELYYAATSTIGYTYPNSKRIWVNTKYFNSNSITSVSANLFHEWLHKLGFAHAVSYSTSRDYSVPYAIGRIIGNIGKTL